MSQLRILKEYSGRRTHEQFIKPGDYDADDPRLFGLAAYLTEHEPARAVWLTDEVLVSETVGSVKPTLAHDDETIRVPVTLSHDEAMDALGRDLPDEPPAKPGRKPKG